MQDRIIKRVDKFLFRLQAQILSVLLPEVKEIIREREGDYLGAVAKETSSKEGT